MRFFLKGGIINKIREIKCVLKVKEPPVLKEMTAVWIKIQRWLSNFHIIFRRFSFAAWPIKLIHRNCVDIGLLIVSKPILSSWLSVAEDVEGTVPRANQD